MAKWIAARELLVAFSTCTIFAILLCPIACGQSPQAAAEEVREFEILVSGKPAGSSTLRIAETQNGLTTVRTDAVVNLSYVVYTYRYEFHGQEVWQANRLVSVEDRAVDGGTRLAINARNDPHGSVIQAQGKNPVAGPVLSMTTSYWRAPDGPKGSTLKLLEADQGNVHNVRIDNITSEQLSVDGKQLASTHYHLDGDLVADLWFDSQHRLVRQQTTEDGYLTELRLTRITTSASQLARH
jgi:hypothetical protein